MRFLNVSFHSRQIQWTNTYIWHGGANHHLSLLRFLQIPAVATHFRICPCLFAASGFIVMYDITYSGKTTTVLSCWLLHQCVSWSGNSRGNRKWPTCVIEIRWSWSLLQDLPGIPAYPRRIRCYNTPLCNDIFRLSLKPKKV